MVKSSTALVPLVGVLIALIVFTIGQWGQTQIQVPRKLDEMYCGPTEALPPRIRVTLHADSSIELALDNESQHVEAPLVLAAIRKTLQHEPLIEVIDVHPDASVSWQQVVETTSSLDGIGKITVALVPDDLPSD